MCWISTIEHKYAHAHTLFLTFKQSRCCYICSVVTHDASWHFYFCFYLKTLARPGLSFCLSEILKCSEAATLTFSTWSESEPPQHTHTYTLPVVVTTGYRASRQQTSCWGRKLAEDRWWTMKENKTFVSAAIFSHNPAHQSPSKITAEIKESDMQ